MMKLPEPDQPVLAFVTYKYNRWYEVLSHDGKQWTPYEEGNEEFYKDPRVLIKGWEYCDKHLDSMTPEELAQKFIRQYDKLSDDDKMKCFENISKIMRIKYDHTVVIIEDRCPV